MVGWRPNQKAFKRLKLKRSIIRFLYLLSCIFQIFFNEKNCYFFKEDFKKEELGLAPCGLFMYSS